MIDPAYLKEVVNKQTSHELSLMTTTPMTQPQTKMKSTIALVLILALAFVAIQPVHAVRMLQDASGLKIVTQNQNR